MTEIKKYKESMKSTTLKYYPIVRKMKVGEMIEIDNNKKEQMDVYNAVYFLRSRLYREGIKSYDRQFKSKQSDDKQKRIIHRIK